jgi:putative membrane protein
VTTKDEFSAPVPNNGTAFSPYFIALSIWMGAVMMSFVLHFTRLPENARGSSQLFKMLEKLSLPVILVLLQSVFLMLALRFILHIEIPNGFELILVMLLGSLGFLFVINALLTILGDAGRLLAVVLLVFQLAAAGSAYPIELSPPLFRAVHSILPITNIIKALRAVLFGSYQGHWQRYAFNLALVGVIALVLTWLIGRWRWRFVPNETYAPALET